MLKTSMHIFYQKLRFQGTVLNQTLSSLHEGSLETTRTVLL